MSDFSKIPIIQCAYQLTLDLHRLVQLLPRQTRFVAGQEILALANVLLDGLITTNHKADPGARLQGIDIAAAKLVSLRLRIRMLKDLRHISIGQAADFNAKMEVISRQLSSWRKWVVGSTTECTAAESSFMDTH